MKVLLTGITGFIARRIALDLLEAGHEVRGSMRDLSRAEDLRAVFPVEVRDRLELVRLSLDDDAGWAEAAQDVDALCHTASPFPMVQTPPDPQTVIRPAVDGTLRALRAARTAGLPVVMTSSTVAIVNGPDPKDRLRDERDWSTPEHPNANAYVRSKTEAERAAWDFADAEGLTLTVLNPGFVLGPPLGDERNTSLGVIERLLAGRDPMVPPIEFETVDVRDVSRAHVAALLDPATAGRRYALVAGPLSFLEIAAIAKEMLPERRIATRQAPAILLRGLALFDPALRGILPILGRRADVTGQRAAQAFGIDYTPAAEAARASIRALA